MKLNQAEAVLKVSGLMNILVSEGRLYEAQECASLLVALTNEPERIPSLLTDGDYRLLNASIPSLLDEQGRRLELAAERLRINA